MQGMVYILRDFLKLEVIFKNQKNIDNIYYNKEYNF